MSLHYGNKNIAEIYRGNKRIKEVYKGSKLLFGGSKLSYVMLTDNTVIKFESDNTPLSNLSTTGGATSSITVNGQSVVKNTIKEIYFGDSYKDVTSIGNYFLYHCSGLTSIDFSGLSNVTSIGNNFLFGCSSPTSVDLSPLSNLTSIGTGFLYTCLNVTTLIMGAKTPLTLGSNAFYRTNNLSLILVPCASENDYKSATNWKGKASIIQGDC